MDKTDVKYPKKRNTLDVNNGVSILQTGCIRFILYSTCLPTIISCLSLLLFSRIIILRLANPLFFTLLLEYFVTILLKLDLNDSLPIR